jgi:heme exporter protein B
MKTFWWFFKSELGLRFRNSGDIVQPLFFFVLLSALFPLSLPSSQHEILPIIAPAVIWLTAVLAILLGLDTVFKSDYQDGMLEQLIVSDHSLIGLILAKVMAHWVMSGLLISLLSPLIAYALAMSEIQIVALFVSLLVGTLSICLVGAFGSALTLAASQTGVLIALLVLPLYIPVLIFGAGLVADASSLASISGPIYMLIAIFVLALTFIPIAISMVFRHVLD